MPKVRVGIVGVGRNAIGHIRAHQALGKSEIVAICDRNEELLNKVGDEFGIAERYTTDEIYQRDDIEAISIHTGDNQHAGPFKLAVAAGKHVLVEKPLANSEQDILDMVKAADDADPKLKIQVGYILRFNPLFEEIHRLTQSGSLGEVFCMEADYVHNLEYQAAQTDPVTGKNWYLDDELPMLGGGSHPLDLLRWISGKEIASVFAYSNHKAFPAMRHDDCEVALFRFTDDTIAKVAALYAPKREFSWFYNLRIYGTNGTVDDDQVAISASPDEVHPPFTQINYPNAKGHPYDPEVADWLDAIVEDRQPRTPLRDGANSSMACLCAIRSAREGREVEVPRF